MKLFEKWKIQDIEDEIISYLDNKKEVFIENGCLNDEIISYQINNYFGDREVIFTTSNCVFPKK